jgi:hypothetical protein
MTDLAEQFSECIDVTDDSSLVQGDIFRWLEPRNDPWQQFGVVVTANCDIAFQKHRGILSYVPLISIKDYLRLFFLPTALRRGVRSTAAELGKALIADEVAEAIRMFQAENLPEFPEPVSDHDALRWALTMSPGEIADELKIEDLGARKRFEALLSEYQAVESALASEAYSEQWDALVRLRIRQGSEPGKAVQKLWSEIGARIRDLPGDCFFLGRLGTVAGEGWIAYLRLVREIQSDSVAVRQPDLKRASTVAMRVARLQSPYIYRLTQQLIGVFASIGLPTEYEKARTGVVDALSVRNQETESPKE